MLLSSEKHEVERHRSQPMTGEGQRQTYLEETYETVLSPRTVLVETTDCDDYGWNVHFKKKLL